MVVFKSAFLSAYFLFLPLSVSSVFLCTIQFMLVPNPLCSSPCLWSDSKHGNRFHKTVRPQNSQQKLEEAADSMPVERLAWRFSS